MRTEQYGVGQTQEKVVYISERGRSERERALAGAMEEHALALRRFLRVRLALEPDREEIMQEVYLKLWKADGLKDRLSSRSGSTRSFLFAIVSAASRSGRKPTTTRSQTT